MADPTSGKRQVYLESNDGTRIHIAAVQFESAGGYQVDMRNAPFGDHFLSMRPFKCLEGPQKHWCHLPYPYDLVRRGNGVLTDLEYDFLFLWKDATDYGIDPWNGVYYRLAPDGDRLVGHLHEVDMNILAAPPAAGVRHPIAPQDLTAGDPDSHWLPVLVIE